MHITELRIRNFRNFLKAKFCFEPGVNTLIGENGSGKTNVFHAIRLLLDESLERNAIYLRETDFCRDLGNWRGHWVVISATFANLDASEGCQLLRHAAAHMNGTNVGTCTYVFRPKKEARKKMFELCGQREELHEFLTSLSIADYEALFTGRAVGDCLDDDTYQGWSGDLMGADCPDPEKEDTSAMGVRMAPIYQEVACTFVRALRDVVSDLRGFRGNPLLTLLRGMESEIQVENAASITDQVRKLNEDISSLEEIKALAQDIEGALKKAVGHTYGPNVDITSSLPDSMERLLQRLSLLIGDSATSEYKGELHEQSLGAANLIYLSLKLLEYERKLSTDRVAHFFLIEEPEAHIHTHIQKTLFANLPSTNTQVIVSTHSTHISSAAKIRSVNVLAKKADHAEVYQPANGMDDKEMRRVERYLDAVRSTLLFAKGVLLVEGDAELVVIPAMLKAVFGVTPDELGFSLISMSSAFFDHIATLFSEERIQRPCAILTDGDAALCELPEDPEEDTKKEAHARAAQESGQLRRTVLEARSATNVWVAPFFAEHTFEVDFLEAGNAQETVDTLTEIYIDAGAMERSEELLLSDDLAVSGQEILRLAAKEGKGWFAVLLAEHLSPWTEIPNYILEAIAFACHRSINSQSLRRMAEYRVEKLVQSGREVARQLAVRARETNLTAEQYVAIYSAAFANDDLTKFCGYFGAYQANDPAE
jgi:putative ATP-dependent endonuclease of OLD family